MNKLLLLVLFIVVYTFSYAQKKPLDHSVYDSWQSIGERAISNNGKWIVYGINVQEGDNQLVIQSHDTSYKLVVPRGYNTIITPDSRFAIFRIRSLFKDTREARIKKKRPDDFPKDSLGIVEFGKDSILKVARVKAYKTPEKSATWVAYHKEKITDTSRQKSGSAINSRVVDSLKRTIDSLQRLLGEKKRKNKDNSDFDLLAQEQFYIHSQINDAEGDDPAAIAAGEGSDLVLRNLETGLEKTFKYVSDYFFNKTGRKLLIATTRYSKDTLSKAFVILHDLRRGISDTLSRTGNEFKKFAISDDGSKVAYIAERDSSSKALQKFYKIWYFNTGSDSAVLLVDKNTVGMQVGNTISENSTLAFSKNGGRLFFGTAPILPLRDTSLIDIDVVKVDVWHYKDDYLQTRQLSTLQNDLRQNFLAVYDLDMNSLHQLASPEIPQVIQTNEGDGNTFVGVTDVGKRIESQWTGGTKKDLYAINVRDGSRKLVKKDVYSQVYPSSTGKYILWYDRKAKNYFSWDGDSIRNITRKIKVPLFDEENDVPEEPGPYGVMGWHEGDSSVYIYDRYDIWRVDPAGARNPENITVTGRKTFTRYRYSRLDPDEKFIKNKQSLYFRTQDQKNKTVGIALGKFLNNSFKLYWIEQPGRFNFSLLEKSKDYDALIMSKENYLQSPDLFYYDLNSNPISNDGNDDKIASRFTRLTILNPQQQQYNWGTAELYKWKAFDGKEATGILFKPEDFNPNKRYPLILYFYEKLSDGVFNYHAPAPTPSRLNIPFFVSRGYLVMAPDIAYITGHPAKSAYNYIVSGAQALAKNKWVDGKNIGIQGQSWGGIQVAQLITMTNIFKAAWAGAPVANMTSAYGGIRWESGLNRQFQYEKSQSRIGATLWEKPQLYIENSPLFHVPKITTPLVIMANDADGAVPWYQGIELFTAMRRMGKKVWLLNYNGEAHNLVERKNRKDIQIREQQYFDWLLKGENPPRWIIEGVPAIKKGKNWGLEF